LVQERKTPDIQAQNFLIKEGKPVMICNVGAHPEKKLLPRNATAPCMTRFQFAFSCFIMIFFFLGVGYREPNK